MTSKEGFLKALGGLQEDSEQKQPTAGIKHDGSKPRMELIPQESLLEIAKVMTVGAAKYGESNWAEGIHISRLLAAATRHLSTFQAADGEDMDAETQTSHLANSATNLLFAIWMMKHRPDLDDRWALKHRKKK